jgi:hypothetical protein
MLDIYQRNIRKGGVIVHLILIRFDKLVKLLKTPHLEAMRNITVYRKIAKSFRDGIYIFDITMLDSYFSIVNCFSPRQFASLQWTTIVRHNVSM